MAILSFADIQSALDVIVAPEMSNVFNRTAAFASMLSVNPPVGQDERWSVYVTDNTPGSLYVAEGTGVTTVNTMDARQTAILDLARALDSFGVTDVAAAKVRSSGGGAGVIGFPKGELMTVAERMFSKLNSELFVGSGAANHIAGIVLAHDASGTYAGLARGSFAKWAGQAVLNGGTPRAVTPTLMRTTITDILIAGGQRPTHFLAHPSQVAALSNSLQTQVQFNQPMNAANPQMGLVQPRPIQWFDGIQAVEDKDCPTDKIVFINMSDTTLIQWAEEFPSVTMPNGLKFYIQPLPDDGSGAKYKLSCLLQLKVRKPNLGGYLGDLQ